MKRVLIFVGLLFGLLLAAAVYLFHAPRPSLSDAQVVEKSIDIGAHARRFRFFVPEKLEAGAPLLLALHHSQSRGSKFRRMVGSALEEIAREDGVLIAYPDGYGGHFNDCRKQASYSARTAGIDDIGFMRAIVDEAAVEYAIDRSRVYAIGHSNGGQMAMRLALEEPGLLAGMIVNSANLPAADNFDCKVEPSLVSSVVLIAGTEDPINPFEGGKVTLFGFGNRGNVLSAQGTAEWFAEQLGLETAAGPEPWTSEEGIAVNQQEWRSLSARLRLVTLEGAGHTVPQQGYRFGRIFGPTLANDRILREAWQFMHRP